MSSISLNNDKINFLNFIKTSEVTSKEESIDVITKLQEPLCLWLTEENFESPFTLSVQDLASNRKEKNALLEKVAKNWIQDAVHHVFPDPLRSFLELIANALDACLPEIPIGKFGMGFLSILAFLSLKETDGCTIQIETTYISNDTSSLFSYKIDISKEMRVTFTKTPPQSASGTKIRIFPHQRKFSKGTLSDLTLYLYYLQFYPHGKILVETDTETFEVGKGEKILAYVVLKETELGVQDQGCGISLEIAQTKLFIPSSSSKGISSKESSEICLPEPVTYQGKKQVDESYFVATLNGVVVVALPFYPKSVKDIHLSMPTSASITLARDAVQFSGKGDFVRQTIDKSVECLIAGNLSSETLVAFYRGLLAWENQTPSVKKMAFSHYLLEQISHKIENNKKLLAIPFEQRDFFLKIAGDCQKHLIPLHQELLKMSFSSLEKTLLAFWKTDSECEKKALSKGIIHGKSLLFVDDALLPEQDGVAQVTSLGLSELIFVPKSLIAYAQARAMIEKNSEEKILACSVAMRFSKEGESLVPVAALRTSFASAVEVDDEFLLINSLSSDGNFKITKALNEGVTKGCIDDDFCEALFKKYDDDYNIFLQYLCDSNTLMRTYDFTEKIRAFQTIRDPEPLKKIIKNYFSSRFDQTILSFANQNLFFFRRITDANLLDQLYEICEKYRESKREATVGPDTGVRGDLKDPLQDELFKFLKEKKLLFLAKPHEVVRIVLERLFASYGITSEAKVFSKSETLWPISGKPDLIEKLFFQLVPRDGGAVKMAFRFSSAFPVAIPKTVIRSHYLTWFSKTIEDHLESFNSLESYLQISLKNFLLPALVANELIQNSDISEELKEKMEIFVAALLKMCREALTISDKEIPFNYGKNALPFSIDSKKAFTFTSDELYQTLLSFRDYPHLFEKLLHFTLDELRDHLFDKETILAKLRNQKNVQLPCHIFLNTSLETFVRDRDRKAFPYLSAILDQARSWEEMLFLSEITLVEDYNIFFLKQENLSHIPEILNTYLREKISEEKLRRICFEIKDGNSSQMFLGIGKPIFEFIDKIEKSKNHFVTRQVFLGETLSTLLENTPCFTIRQLLTALYKEPLLEKIDEGNLDAFIKMIRVYKEKTELQIINQSVEHASNRGPIAAVVECLQNSLDALKSFDSKVHPESWKLRHRLSASPEEVEKQLSTISYSVEILENANSSQLILVIKDGVGMLSLKTLLIDFLIPGLSEKGQKENQLGKMGNGSFQIYKDVEVVLLKTRLLSDPSKVYLIKLFPIRNEKKEVIDLSVKCIDISEEYKTEPFFGVEFQILFSDQKKDTHLQASSLRDWIRENVAKTYCENDKIRLVLKALDGSEELLQGLKTDGLKIQSTTIPFTFIQTKNPHDEGLVLTDIYLAPLSSFLVEMDFLPGEIAEKFARGWCLNLPPKSYAPVQSRTKVHMEKAQREELKLFIAEWLCLRTLLDEPNGPGKMYYPHFASPAPFSQIYPNTNGAPRTKEALIDALQIGNLSTFFVNYPIERFGGKSFIALIDRGYKQLVHNLKLRKKACVTKLKLLPKDCLTESYTAKVRRYRRDCVNDFKKWQEKQLKKANGDPIFKQYLAKVIFKWFEQKVAAFSNEVPSLPNLKEQHQNLKTSDEILAKEKTEALVEKDLKAISFKPTEIRGLCEEMLSLYCQLFDEGNLAPSTRLFYESLKKKSGYYTRAKHCIFINLFSYKPSVILELALALAVREVPSLELKGSALILITLSQAGALNHELEHARRRSDCRKNFHEDAEDVYGKKMHFEGCAKAAARKALRNGLWDKWCDQMSENLKKRGITAESLKEWISLLRKFEEDPASLKILCDLLLN